MISGGSFAFDRDAAASGVAPPRTTAGASSATWPAWPGWAASAIVPASPATRPSLRRLEVR